MIRCLLKQVWISCHTQKNATDNQDLLRHSTELGCNAYRTPATYRADPELWCDIAHSNKPTVVHLPSDSLKEKKKKAGMQRLLHASKKNMPTTRKQPTEPIDAGVLYRLQHHTESLPELGCNAYSTPSTYGTNQKLRCNPNASQQPTEANQELRCNPNVPLQPTELPRAEVQPERTSATYRIS